jgi:chromosome partitioning protein
MLFSPKKDMMQVVSVINYKGGVGKTTLTANLGAELAYRGSRVLLLDLDPQASLTFSFVRPDYWRNNLAKEGTIKRWYDSFGGQNPLDLASIIISPKPVGPYLGNANGALDLIPSDLGLINVDLELATELGGANLRQAKLKYLRVHRRLADELAKPAFTTYDFVLIDCPPNFNIVTKTAIVASDSILIPAKADYLSTLGIEYLHRSLDQLVADYNEYAQLAPGESDVGTIKPQILGVVFTMLQFYAGQPIAALRQYIEQTKLLGVPVFDGYLRENKTLFGDAPEDGVPLVLRNIPGANAQRVVGEIETLVTEFQNLLEA